MTRRDRLRRTALLCLHCLRNLAFYRAAHEASKAWAGEQFWITANNALLDIGLLEWCKLFGDPRAKHDWRKSVVDQGSFLPALLEHLRLTEQMFADYIAEVRTYRDKFVAHLDEEERMNIPNLAPVIKSAQFLYQRLREVEDDCNAFPDAPPYAIAYFRENMAEARAVYAAKTAA